MTTPDPAETAPVSTDALVAWLRTQLDEDERVASAVLEAGGPWYSVHVLELKWGLGRVDAEHIARWDPTRVLREVEAKRRLLDEYDRVRAEVEAGYLPEWERGKGEELELLYERRRKGFLQGLEFAILTRAAVYSDRPGYQSDWAP